MALGLGLGLQNENKVSEAFSLTDLSGLKLWLKYDTGIILNGSSVSSCVDQSGEGYTAEQSDSDKQPNYSSGNIRFDGTDDRFELKS